MKRYIIHNSFYNNKCRFTNKIVPGHEELHQTNTIPRTRKKIRTKKINTNSGWSYSSTHIKKKIIAHKKLRMVLDSLT